MVKRGNCVLEAQTLVGRLGSLAPESSWARESREDLTKAFSDFEAACNNPPKPPGSRTETELKRYKAELVDALRKDCAEFLGKRD
jgi:hypothetical protein